ncbi:ABC transporter permease [Rhizobium sp. TH2]|uniref:ABC transporter permease n=1 Tax=Rhizobium sp. TH2 TaxID=2775403 RepID=UPI0021582716|nr:ABC transporter permease [Rhizobium sp. TH2]UVC09228.1 ABC transporter permease [Rhizobium sp. TH2]
MSTNELGSTSMTGLKKVRRLPAEVSILGVLFGIAIVFEILGWYVVGESFLANKQRLSIIVLQVAVIGIIAVGVTQVIITGGVDLSSGSMVGFIAMVAASFAQTAINSRAVFLQPEWSQFGLSWFIDSSPLWAIGAGLLLGLLLGFVNGFIIARTGIPPFIATLGMMVSVRGLAKWYTEGQPVALLNADFTWLGQSFDLWGFPVPRTVIIFFIVAIICHVALSYTRYGKFTYAIGANPLAARVSGIDIGKHLIKVYAVAGLLSGLAGVMLAARAQSGQPNMGVAFELDAIAATVIGGTSLAGGVGRITGTVIGTIILGVVTSGFTFLKVGAYYQEIVKGLIIVTAVAIDVYRQKRKGRA